MSGRSAVVLMVLLVFVGFGLGCSDSVFDGDEDSGPVGPSSGSYAGTWTGNVCGRALTMSIAQNGGSLSGSYTLSDPTFSETFVGSVSITSSPAPAVLNGGGDRRFEVTFFNYTNFSGGYYKGSQKVCDTSAAKQ